MACFRLFTLPPFPPRPLFAVLRLYRRISLSTSRPALGSICASVSLPLSVLHVDEVHLSPNRFSHKKLRNVRPSRPEQMPGMWQRYYERWRAATRECLDMRLLEMMPPLAALWPPATAIDKMRRRGGTRLPRDRHPRCGVQFVGRGTRYAHASLSHPLYGADRDCGRRDDLVTVALRRAT